MLLHNVVGALRGVRARVGFGALLVLVAPSAFASAAAPSSLPALSRQAAADPPGLRWIGDAYGDQHLIANSRERFPTPGVPAVYLAPNPQVWAPIAGAVLKDGPVLYGRTRGSLPPAVVAEIRRLKPRRVVGLGNPWLLSDATLRAAAPGLPVTRIPGLDQYSLAVGVSRYRYPRHTPSTVYLLNGAGYAPGDVWAAAMLREGSVLLVPRKRSVPRVVLDEVRRLAPSRVVAIGGSDVVSDATLRSVAGGRRTARIAGATRYDTAVAVARSAYRGKQPRVYLANGPFSQTGPLTALGPVLPFPGRGADLGRAGRGPAGVRAVGGCPRRLVVPGPDGGGARPDPVAGWGRRAVAGAAAAAGR